MGLNARQRNMAPIYVSKSLYGQLQHILVVKLPPAEELDSELTNNTTYFLGGRREVVDITTVQCLVGRVPLNNDWVIIDYRPYG